MSVVLKTTGLYYTWGRFGQPFYSREGSLSVQYISFFGFTKKIIIQGDVASAAVKQVNLTEYCVYCSDGTYC